MSYAWRGLGGGELKGDTVTRFVYIDEAGISRKEPIVTVAGVIVHADRQLNELERRLQHLVEKYIPENQREGFVFHATELFNGGGVFVREKWPLQKRLEIAKKLAEIPGKMDLRVTVGTVVKKEWPRTFDPKLIDAKERDIGQHLTAYMSCIMQVEMWMRSAAPTNEITMMIVEDNAQARSRIRDTQNAHRQKNVLAELGPSGKKYFPFRKIKHSPLFEQKKDSPALQMADFCAYVMKKVAMNDPNYDRLGSLISPQFAVHDLPTLDGERRAKKRR